MTHGTHAPVSDEQRIIMFGEDIPADAFLVHDSRLYYDFAAWIMR